MLFYGDLKIGNVFVILNDFLKVILEINFFNLIFLVSILIEIVYDFSYFMFFLFVL